MRRLGSALPKRLQVLVCDAARSIWTTLAIAVTRRSVLARRLPARRRRLALICYAVAAIQLVMVVVIAAVQEHVGWSLGEITRPTALYGDYGGTYSTDNLSSALCIAFWAIGAALLLCGSVQTRSLLAWIAFGLVVLQEIVAAAGAPVACVLLAVVGLATAWTVARKHARHRGLRAELLLLVFLAFLTVPLALAGADVDRRADAALFLANCSLLEALAFWALLCVELVEIGIAVARRFIRLVIRFRLGRTWQPGVMLILIILTVSATQSTQVQSNSDPRNALTFSTATSAFLLFLALVRLARRRHLQHRYFDLLGAVSSVTFVMAIGLMAGSRVRIGWNGRQRKSAYFPRSCCSCSLPQRISTASELDLPRAAVSGSPGSSRLPLFFGFGIVSPSAIGYLANQRVGNHFGSPGGPAATNMATFVGVIFVGTPYAVQLFWRRRRQIRIRATPRTVRQRAVTIDTG